MMIANFSRLAVVGVLFTTLGLAQSAELRGQGGAKQDAADGMEKEMRKLSGTNAWGISNCVLTLSITCTVGNDNIECGSFQKTPDRCLYENVYTFTFENKGDATLNFIEVTSNVPGAEPTDLISFVPAAQLGAGQSTVLSQTQRVDYCRTDELTATVIAKATQGLCMAKGAHSFIPN